jgi:steroid delta-isomerase-like uncharacterized protein
MAAASARTAAVKRYFDSWNTREPARVVSALAHRGTYTDPTVMSPPLSELALEGHLRNFIDAVPDVSLEVADAPVIESQVSSRVAVSWVMRGTHSGRLNGMPPLGGSLSLRGVDLITIEHGQIRAVERHFDRQTMAEQLGFQTIVQPASDDVWQLGYSWRASSGSTAAPGAISITWTEVRSPEEAEQLEEVGSQFGAELTQVPGFISVVTGGVGSRLFTVAAWENADAIPLAMRNKLHTGGVKRFYTDDFLGSFGSGVFSVQHLGPVLVRCTSCARVIDLDGFLGDCSCGHPLPEPPQRW